ncbi:MAG: heterodisulfide reductase [Deltaproteobacteria bacterium]|nr:MAG: heterodisulfide reductase [Deltaproteobacteria bacterium]
MKKIDEGFLRDVEEKCGHYLGGCFHCMACSSGCPAVELMDYYPNQLVRLIQLGYKDEVLSSKSIWVCVGCYSCVAQCPNRIHIPHMMDALREIALDEGVPPGEPDIWSFHREFLNQVNKRGRVYEIEFMMRYKMATGSYFKDVGAGLQMLRHGRLDLLPTKVKKLKEIRLIGDHFNGRKK